MSSTTDLIALAEMPKDQIRREIDKNYLTMLVEQNPNLKKQDFVEFITKCQLTGADPRLNQVYLLVHNAWNAQKGIAEPKGTTVFAYQFFIQVAQKTGELEGFGVDTAPDTYVDFVSSRERKSLTATAWVKRKGGARYEYKARLWEFAKTDKSGNMTGTWKNSPYLMLEKCAVANAMRWAFPEALSGIYIKDEIENDTQVSVKPIEAPRIEISKPKTIEAAPDHELEDLRQQILDFLAEHNDEWYAKIGKDRVNMVAVVQEIQKMEVMKKVFEKMLEYDKIGKQE